MGKLLEQRRHDLGYRHLKTFAEEKGFKSTRVLSDLENAKRTNFSRGTLLEVEDAYAWVRGSIDSILNSGDPTTAEGQLGVRVKDLRPPPSRLRREIRELLDSVPDTELLRVRDYLYGFVNKG